jgi:pimeloyl-ACP methyl ester carboxylesterase
VQFVFWYTVLRKTRSLIQRAPRSGINAVAMSNEKMVDVNGVQLCTEGFGDPAYPSILLIAGAASSMDWWEDAFCARLASQQRHVVRYDLRDTGRSTTCAAEQPDYTGFDLVEDAAGVLGALGIARAHIVGISMGGALAQLLALDFPARVASLTLVSTSPAGGSSSDLPPMSDRLKAAFAHPAEAPAWSDREAVIRYIVDGVKLFAGSCTASDTELRAVVSRVVDRTIDMAASQTNHWILEAGYEPWRSRLGTLRVPTLVIHGTEDPLFPCEHGVALSKEIPGATLLLLEGVGHEMPPRQVWDRVIAALVRHTSHAPGDGVPPLPR